MKNGVNKMKKIICLVIAAVFLTTFSACSGNKTSEPLRVGIMPDVDSILLILAQDKGYFEKEGIKVEIQSFKSAPDRDSALQSGKLDGAVSDMLAAAFAAEGGFELKITSMTNGSYKLLVGKNSGIEDFSGLKGKSIAISKNTIIEYATDSMLKVNEIQEENIQKTIIPQIPVRLEMLQNGKVDAATLPEPLATVAQQGGAKVLGSTDQLNIKPGVLVFTKKACDTKTKELEAFYRAYNEAVQYVQKEPVESYIDLVIEKAGFPEAVKGALVLPEYTKASLAEEKDFSEVMEWLKSKELIKSQLKYEDLAEDRFVGAK